MNTNLLSAMLIAGLSLGGCGPSASELKAIADQEAADRLERDRIQREAEENARIERERLARERTAQISELSNTIRSKLDPTGAADYSRGTAFSWEISIAEMNDIRWVWTETEQRAVAHDDHVDNDGYDRLTFTLNPADLSASVNVSTYRNAPAVRISCKSSDCIRVAGVTGSPDAGTTAVERFEDANYFPVPVSFDAEAVATAMRQLINIANGSGSDAMMEGTMTEQPMSEEKK